MDHDARIAAIVAEAEAARQPPDPASGR